MPWQEWGGGKKKKKKVYFFSPKFSELPFRVKAGQINSSRIVS